MTNLCQRLHFVWQQKIVIENKFLPKKRKKNKKEKNLMLKREKMASVCCTCDDVLPFLLTQRQHLLTERQ